MKQQKPTARKMRMISHPACRFCHQCAICCGALNRCNMKDPSNWRPCDHRNRKNAGCSLCLGCIRWCHSVRKGYVNHDVNHAYLSGPAFANLALDTHSPLLLSFLPELRILWYPASSVARSLPWPRYCVDFQSCLDRDGGGDDTHCTAREESGQQQGGMDCVWQSLRGNADLWFWYVPLW